MTLRDYTANVISATKVVPDGNFKDSKASGVWDINEALDLIKGGNWPNAANFNPASFVDGLFQTTLWTGNSSTQTITTDIDLSNKGGLLWFKQRTSGSNEHNWLLDSERTAQYTLSSNLTSAQINQTSYAPTFTSTGFSLYNWQYANDNNEDYVGWTFRKQPKFFDIQTYTGSGENGQTISHDLGVAPGMVIVKDISTTASWYVYHRSLGSGEHLKLNSTNAVSTDSNYEIGKTTASATEFSIDTGSEVDASGNTYVAYFFAHNNNDGGFGEPGDQDIIKCDKIDSTSNDIVNVTLGFEPQFIMIKKSSTTGDWQIFDNMRGMPHGTDDQILAWNTNGAESNSNRIKINPDGFTASGFGTNTDYIYMAIRRGGMQTPSTASSVFSIDTKGSSAPYFDSNHIVDMALVKSAGATGDWYNYARLLGEKYLATNSRAAQANASEAGFDFMNGHIDSDWGGTNAHSWMWKRARGYFDIVTWNIDGTGLQTINHNLGVAPEMIWSKNRDDNGSGSGDWWIGHTGLTGWDGDNENDRHALKFTNAASAQQGYHKNLTTTSMQLGGNAVGGYNTSHTGIAYLFATVAGVSKVGSYTGTGSAQNIDCGFTSGAKFVLIKRTDSADDWIVVDTERGIVAGNDPYLALNANDAQLTSQDYVDPYSAGFAVTGENPVGASSGTYIFYAIA